jgi:1,2-diacylglycerol 3-alpha-glucosyltransferase
MPVGFTGPEPAYAWLPSYQVPALVPRGYRLPSPLAAAGALRALRRFEPDVIHAHSPFVTGRFARRAAGRLQVPLVFTHHTRFADYAHYLGPLAGPTAPLPR